jgi:hypothetical protein
MAGDPRRAGGRAAAARGGRLLRLQKWGAPVDLNLYERAYLCGGPDRAARMGLLSLHAAASVRVAESPPHRVERAHRRAGHSIELALLDGLPSSGLPVRLVLRGLAESPAVDRCVAALLKKKLLRRSFRGLVRPTRAGVELRERLAADVGDDELVRFAVIGTPPEALQPVVVGLPPEAEFPLKLSRQAKQDHDGRDEYDPPLGNAAGGAP